MAGAATLLQQAVLFVPPPALPCFMYVPEAARVSGEYTMSLFLTEAAFGCTEQIGPGRKSPDTCLIKLEAFQSKTSRSHCQRRHMMLPLFQLLFLRSSCCEHDCGETFNDFKPVCVHAGARSHTFKCLRHTEQKLYSIPKDPP